VLYHQRDWESGGPAVLMSEWWVREHWGRAFDILQIDPQFHNYSWAVLRRRNVNLTTDDVEAPSDDPREYAAVRHNVRQLQREVVEELDFARALHEQALEAQANRYRALEERALQAQAAGYERSTSWKVTRPLRVAARLARGLVSAA
jgi:hypothetical protein